VKKKETYPSCDWSSSGGKTSLKTEKNRTFHHRGDFTWKGIRTENYKVEEGSWSSILRRVLIGNNNENTRFHVRYFEIAPGGFSSFEMHKHAHVVIVVRGKGKARIGKRSRTVNFMDTLYIKGLTPHQLSNPFEEPFGFLCIVNAKRDRPRIID